MASRLSKRIENQTKRNVIISFIGIAAILGVLWKFGLPILAGASFMLAGGKEQTPKNEKPAYVAPPTLNDTYSATPSATITISGSSMANATITLFVNNAKVDSVKTDADHSFTFERVPLNQGENTIKAQAEVSQVNSEYSNSLTISYVSKEPTLTVDSPSDGSSYHKDDKSVEVKGTTDPGVKVTVNDFWAIVDTDGKYTYTLPLHDGDNAITVIATDAAGNTSTKSLKVTYSQ